MQKNTRFQSFVKAVLLVLFLICAAIAAVPGTFALVFLSLFETV